MKRSSAKPVSFSARTFDVATGDYAERQVSGSDEVSVRLALERDGLTVLSIARPRGRPLGKTVPFDVVLFCEELRTLLSSGMTLVEAVDTLYTKDNPDGKRDVLRAIDQHLREGKPLSTALELNPFPFPVLLVASVRAGERTSRIDAALGEFIAYEKVAREMGRKLVSAAIYPSLVVGFGMLVCLFMLAYVVPRFGRVYEDFAKGLSPSTMILMRVGQFMGDHLALIGLVLAMVIGGTIVMWRNGQAKVFALRCLGRLSVARHYLRLYQLARIYQTMAMLLKGGYTVSDAMPLAQNLAFDSTLNTQFSKARQAIMEGRRVSVAFAEQDLSDSVAARLLQVGERSGELANILEVIGQGYRQDLTLFIERATRLAEPLLLMAVALMVGAIIVLMYMPIFDLAGGI